VSVSLVALTRVGIGLWRDDGGDTDKGVGVPPMQDDGPTPVCRGYRRRLLGQVFPLASAAFFCTDAMPFFAAALDSYASPTAMISPLPAFSGTGTFRSCRCGATLTQF